MFLLTYVTRNLIPKEIRYLFRIQNYSLIQSLFLSSGQSNVMLTAKGQDIDKQRGREVGADDYFTKPFSPLELMDKVEEVLG